MVRIGAVSGSSPLARGLLGDVGGDDEAGRIIPARAGFTAGGDDLEGLVADHPRSRGVYAVLADGAALADRIIPARAGFTT